MNNRLALILLLFVVIPPVLAADKPKPETPASSKNKVYKTTDEAGRPVFSDQGQEGAQEIEVQEPMSYPGQTYSREYQRTVKPAQAKPFKYAMLTVTAPSDQEAVRNNAGNVTIQFSVNPWLKSGHKMELVVDGAPVRLVNSPEPVTLTNLDRGTHQVRLRVLDGLSEKVIQESGPVSFTVLRHSIRH